MSLIRFYFARLLFLNNESTTPPNCIGIDSIVVVVVPPLVAEAGNGDTICVNSGPVTLAGFSPGNGEWSGPGLVDTIAGTFEPANMSIGANTVFYTFAHGSSCETTD